MTKDHFRQALGIVFFLVGVVVGAGGAWLALIGGTLFYFLLGVALIVSGALVVAGSALGLWAYAATLLLSLVWALWEVGFDWWQLAPRGGLLVILGLILAVPAMARSFKERSGALPRTGGWIALCLSIAACFAVAAAAMLASPHDVEGTLASAARPAAEIATAGVPPGEWHAYGRTPHGRRFSPLDQITPANASKLEQAWTYHTGDVRGPRDPNETTYEVTPLMIKDTLYLCTPHHIVIALDAETGSETGRCYPKIKQPDPNDTQHLTCRGVSYHDGAAAAGGEAPGVPSTAALNVCFCRQRMHGSSLSAPARAPSAPASVVRTGPSTCGRTCRTSSPAPITQRRRRWWRKA